MADIKDRIKKIEPYFKGMQVDEADGEQIIYVMVNFPPKWIIQDDTPDKFDVSIGREDTLYYFCAKLEQGFDIIFDAIDYNIAEMKAALERSQIFRQKMAELQEKEKENADYFFKILKFTLYEQKQFTAFNESKRIYVTNK